MVAAVPAQPVASAPFGARRVIVEKLPGRPSYCPKGFVLEVVQGRTVVARHRYQPESARITGPLCGTEFRWLRAGRLIAVDFEITPSIGEETQVFRLRGHTLRLVRSFLADRIRARGPTTFVLTWLYAARNPRNHKLEVWSVRRGRFVLVRTG